MQIGRTCVRNIMESHRKTAPIRLTTVILLFLIPCTSLVQVHAHIERRSSRSFYPLAMGDYWEYDSYSWGSVGPWDTLIVGVTKDSTFGGHTYQLMAGRSTHDKNSWRNFDRVDSSGDVFRGDPTANREGLLYRLSDTSSSWWVDGSSYLHRFDSCKLGTILGSRRAILYVGEYSRTDTTLRNQRVLVQGLGYYTTIFYGLVDYGGDFLRGARIDGIIFGTITAVQDPRKIDLPVDFRLRHPYPNPFNPSTNLDYSVPVRTRVQILVYDLHGQLVRTLVDQVQEPGIHTTQWNASGTASGVYFCRMLAGTSVRVQRLLLLR